MQPVQKNAQICIEGNRTVSRAIPYYNLDMIISVGSYVLDLLFAFLAFTYPFIQDSVLKRKKLWRPLAEQYKTMVVSL